MNIYTNYVVVVFAYSTVYEKTTFDRYNRRIEYAQVHLSITNSVFSNIYASNTLISYEMNKIKQNINITNCNFTNLKIGESGILVSKASNSASDSESYGGSYYSISGFNRTLVFLPAIYTVLSNIYTKNIRFSNSLVGVQYYSNFVSVNFTSLDLSSGTIKDPFEIVITQFIKAGKYLSRSPPVAEIVEYDCLSVVSLGIVTSVVLENILFDSLNCQNYGVASISLNDLTSNFTLTNSKFYNIAGKSQSGLILDIQTVNNTKIDNMIITNVTNDYFSVINGYGMYEFALLNAKLTNLTAWYHPLIYASFVSNMTVTNISCYKCESLYGNGGVISLLLGNPSIGIFVSNGKFTNCFARNGRGAVLLADSLSILLKFPVVMNNISIYNCGAKEGIISFTDSLNMTESLITNLSIDSSSSVLKGIITDEHADGILVINGLYASGNTAPYSCLYGFYQSSIASLKITNANIANYIDTNTIFYFESNKVDSIINFSTIFITNCPNAIGIQINTLQLIANQLSFNNIQTGVIIRSNSTVSLSNTFISKIVGNAFIIYNGRLNCENCYLENSYDTLIKLIEDGYVNFTNSSFKGVISTSQASVLYAVNSNNDYSIFTKCNFTENYSNSQGVIALQNSKLRLLYCRIYENLSKDSLYSGILMYHASLYVQNSLFANQSLPFIHAELNSDISLDSSVFTNYSSENGASL